MCHPTVPNALSKECSSSTNTGKVEFQPQQSHPHNVEVIEPGLVVLRQFINDDECERIARMAQQMGSKSNGEDDFYTTDPRNGKTMLNTGEAGRGRIYDKATRFPPQLIRHSDTAVSTACDADASMPSMNCTHLLVNMYTTAQGLCWHRDIYENDGTSDHPVVNLSIGATCVFGFKHEDTDKDRTVTLRSGDVLLFGGACRLIKHAILKVDLSDCPSWMKESPCRFSFTFRDSPEVLGREDEFKYFRVSEHLVGQSTFQKPTDRKSFRGLPSHATQKQKKMIPHRRKKTTAPPPPSLKLLYRRSLRLQAAAGSDTKKKLLLQRRNAMRVHRKKLKLK